MLALCPFCLHFSEFGYVTEFFYVPDFFYVSKKLRKSLGHRKMSVLVFFTNKKFKKTRQNDFFLCFSEKSLGHIKCWDSVIFLLHFSEFGYVTNFFYVFRWTRLFSTGYSQYIS
jgi:hypothetical protein